MMLFVFVPWIFTGLLWRWLCLSGYEIRAAFLAANVISGILVVFSTEAFSAFQQLHFLTLLIFWCFVTVLVFWRLFTTPRAFIWSFPGIEWTLLEKILLGAGIFIAGVVGFIALYAPPNTWDSMTYHMARVAHWQHNRGVMYYPTNVMRQLVYLPFAEYVILQWQILSGGDRFANMVQWSAMVVSGAGVSLIAAGLGISRSGQIITVLLGLTLPMGILQGSSTQNDYVVTASIVSSVSFMLFFIKEDRRRWIIMAALSAALAVFTKGTGLVMTLPFVVMVLFFSKTGIIRKGLFTGVVIGAVILCSALFYGRLLAIDKNPLAAINKGGNISMEKHGPGAVGSNILRNLSTELASPWQELNGVIEGTVKSWHQVLGVDIEDPASTSSGPYRLQYLIDEDYMPNPLHMLLLLVTGVLFWFIRSKGREVWFYAAAFFIGVMMFCLTVKWQPWISRFHVPFFILAMPLAVYVMEKFFHRRVIIVIVLVAFCAGLHPLVLNNTRRLFSAKAMFRQARQVNYFVKHSWEYPLASKVWEDLKSAGCRDLGLKTGEDGWDYTWHIFSSAGARVEHVAVTNGTEAFSYPGGEFHPCAVVDLTDSSKEKGSFFNGQPYSKIVATKGFALYFDVSGVRRR